MRLKDSGRWLITLFIIIAICLLLVKAYVLIRYGGAPMSECPTWAWWLLQNNN